MWGKGKLIQRTLFSFSLIFRSVCEINDDSDDDEDAEEKKQASNFFSSAKVDLINNSCSENIILLIHVRLFTFAFGTFDCLVVVVV